MKHFSVLLIFLCIALIGRSNPNLDTDSITFEAQRQRINALLDDRSKRFGEFDSSLRKKTGVFGIFKRKRDMQRSIDILREIVLTDNDIFIETKKLLDIKGYESDKNESLAEEYDRQISGYMRTITKLQSANENAHKRILELEAKQRKSHSTILLLILSNLVTGFILYKRFRRPRS